ncbi:hypothetical protein [Bacteroides acidifaciens]|uniref:hypothetical protein n=1 Tax=Bacteroides acidifaciens TaxID=85831 RepID=UPI00263A7099|nr:hypothetical protein [Bacteroides acidifaciens]
MTVVQIFSKKISDELKESVSKPYYKKEALKELIDICTNAAARETLVNQYTAAYTEWKTAMDELERSVLGKWYQGFTYTFNITFADNYFTLQGEFDDAGYMETICSYLRDHGFVVNNNKVPGQLLSAQGGDQ